MSDFPLTLGNKSLNGFTFRMAMKGTRKMALWLRALAALAQDLSSIPSTHMSSHKHLYLWFQQIMPSSSSVTTRYTVGTWKETGKNTERCLREGGSPSIHEAEVVTNARL